MGSKESTSGGEGPLFQPDKYRVGSVGWGLVPAQPPPEELVAGEHPIGDMRILDAHDMEGEIEAGELRERAREFEERHPSVIERAGEMKEDVIAFVGEHKKGIVLVGSGLAAIFVLTGYIIHRHNKHRHEAENSVEE